MRVLIYGFSGKILGGIETFILNMNEHMSSDTVFDYIIDGETCVYRDRIEQRGGRILFVPGVRKHPLGYVSTFRKILKEQKRQGTNILYIQLFSMANMLPAFLGKMLGYKVILHAHNNGLQSKSKIYEYIHLVGKFLTKKVGFVRFTNSQLSTEFMFGRGMEAELIYNAIDTKLYSFKQEWRDSIRKEMGSGNKTVIGFVGRLVMQKNPMFMLKIFSEYHKLNSQSELWIVGEGELQSDMITFVVEEQLDKSVKWLGRRNDVAKVMCGMDLLLQPSIFEGLGIVLIEAQSECLPCVSSSIVIPQEAQATNLLKLVNLDEPLTKWIETCMYQSNINRNSVSQLPQNYNIKKEARRLEEILQDYDRL